MCLSVAYKNEVKDENILMKNVMSFNVVNNVITLTDLMEHKLVVNGHIEKVDLMDNFIIVKEEGKDE